MDVASIIALGAVLTGIIGAIVALRRAPGDEVSTAVKTQKDVLADMRDLVDELVEALERCRADRKELETALATAKKLANTLHELEPE